MKYVLFNSVLVVFMMALTFNAPVVFAEESETLRSRKGFVKTIDDNKIVVSEYDKAKNAEVQVTYLLTPDTQAEIYGDIPVKQIKVGDEVEIDYQMNQKKKVAEFVSVDLSSYE